MHSFLPCFFFSQINILFSPFDYLCLCVSPQRAPVDNADSPRYLLAYPRRQLSLSGNVKQNNTLQSCIETFVRLALAALDTNIFFFNF